MSLCPHFDLVDPDTYTDGIPFSWFAQLRGQCPVSWQEDPRLGRGYWAITKRDHLDFVSKAPEWFSSAAECSQYGLDENLQMAARQLFMNMDPPDHVKYRRIVRNAFIPRAVDSYEPHLRAVAADIVGRVAPKGRCEFVSEVASELPLVAICELMGIPVEDRRQFFAWTNTMIGENDPELADPQQATIAFISLLEYGRSLATMQRDTPRNDIVGALLHGTVEGEYLSDDEFANFFLLLLVAGIETTRTMISQGMRLLIEHPDQYRKLQARPELVPHAVEEILRCEPPVIQFCRTAMRDIELGGAQIRRGDRIVLFYPSANRDEEVFPNSDVFDVERDLREDIRREHRAFGIGEHFCLGSHLARLELRVMFDEIVRRLHNPRFDGPAARLRAMQFNGLKAMPIVFEGR